MNQTEKIYTSNGIITSKPTSASDLLCVYTDGQLFISETDSTNLSMSLTDNRPSSGVGDNEVVLVSHLTFDDSSMKNSCVRC